MFNSLMMLISRQTSHSEAREAYMTWMKQHKQKAFDTSGEMIPPVSHDLFVSTHINVYLKQMCNIAKDIIAEEDITEALPFIYDTFMSLVDIVSGDLKRAQNLSPVEYSDFISSFWAALFQKESFRNAWQQLYCYFLSTGTPSKRLLGYIVMNHIAAFLAAVLVNNYAYHNCISAPCMMHPGQLQSISTFCGINNCYDTIMTNIPYEVFEQAYLNILKILSMYQSLYLLKEDHNWFLYIYTWLGNKSNYTLNI